MINKMKSKLNFKIFWALFLFLTLCSASIYGALFVTMPASFKMNVKDNLMENFTKLVQTLPSKTLNEGLQSINEFSNSNDAVCYMSPVNNQNIIHYFGNYTPDINITGSNKYSICSDVKFSDSDTVYEVNALTDSYKTVNLLLEVLINLIPYIFILITILSALGAFIAARLITKPIIQISRTSEIMSEHKENVHCEIKRKDEIGILANNLNTMYVCLMQALDELEEQSKKLRKEIEKEKKVEKRRKEFFNATSHELKTPVTILKGELEGMLYGIGDYKNTNKYLAHSIEVVDEIEKLVKEILSISKMGDESYKINKKECSISEIVYKCCDNYVPMANFRNMDMICDVEEEISRTVDEELFYKALSNIINNAISYSPQNSRVYVELDTKCLRVENTGAHIESEYLSEVCEPFYRLDSSRNRNSGGSGLGLYIVNNILELHGMKHEISNSKDGVVFTIWI